MSCNGFYGDVAQEEQEGGNEKDALKLQQLLFEYNEHKSRLAKKFLARTLSTVPDLQSLVSTPVH